MCYVSVSVRNVFLGVAMRDAEKVAEHFSMIGSQYCAGTIIEGKSVGVVML